MSSIHLSTFEHPANSCGAEVNKVASNLSERSLVVTIAGMPNAGKSTLINRIVDQQISIVTPKEQTTRGNVRGVHHDRYFSRGPTELIFVDTPGLFVPRSGYNLEKAIIQQARTGISEAGAVLFMISSKLVNAVFGIQRVGAGIMKVRDAIAMARRVASGPLILVLNKADLLDDEEKELLSTLLSDTEEGKNGRARLADILKLTDEIGHGDIFALSALHGHGLGFLLLHLQDLALTSPWVYEPGCYTDVSERKLSEEITRKHLYLQLHEELPYSLFVETEKWFEGDDGVTEIYQVVFVNRANHKSMIIGSGARTIKKIGEAARLDIAKTLGKKVRLFLHVKVKSDWTKQASELLS